MSRLIITALIATCLFLSACGSSSTNNDQGTAFTLIGFFDPEDLGDISGCELPTGVASLTVPLNDPSDEVSGSSGRVTAAMGLQNNLTQQFVRVDRVFFSYQIPGASDQPPSTSQALGFVINPTVVQSSSSGDSGSDSSSDAGFDSSLPPGFNGDACSRQFATVPVVPSEIRTWLNFNRDSLPETPFSMTVIVSARGITSAGDVLETNEAALNVEVTSDLVIAPTDGADASEFGDEGLVF